VTVSDPDPFARDFALRHGADAAIDPLSPDAWEVPDAFDIVFEASGATAALCNGIEATARGGTLVLVGTLPDRVELPANLVMNRELTLRGSFRFANVFSDALRLVAAGILSLDGLVTHVFPFEETPQALQAATARRSVMKVQIAS
jgi:L-iditol 2-dehydrogenase